MDDITLSREMSAVEKDVTAILEANVETGFHLNTAKCEITMEDFSEIGSSSVFANFVRVEKSETTLLGAPVIKCRAQDRAITDKTE